MAKITVSEIFLQRDHWLLFRGLLYLYILSSPLFIFVGIMGGAAPNSPGFFYSVGVTLGFMIKETLTFLFLFKLIDSCVTRRLAKSTFSYFAIILGALIYTIYFNVVYDHLFQFKQGNYDISVMAMGAVIALWAMVIAVGHIRFGKTPPVWH